MKAMVLPASAPIEEAPLQLRELPRPDPGAGEVRLRVRCCAVCRTDLHVIEGDLPAPRLPLIPGHQIVGVVDAVGPGCRLKPGILVGVAWLRGTCGSCAHCTAGRENLCDDSRYTGFHTDGGYAEYALAPEDWVYELPEGFDEYRAAPLLCAGLMGYRALERCGVAPGERLAIFGFGSSAHVVLQIALHRGCTVYVVSRSRTHLEHAQRMGAAWAGSDPAGMPEPADGAILFAPAGALVPPALAALRKGGTLALAGIYMSSVPGLDYERHLFYERTLLSVTANTRADGLALMALAGEIPIRPEIQLFSLAEANRALQALKQGSIAGTGVLTVGNGG